MKTNKLTERSIKRAIFVNLIAVFIKKRTILLKQKNIIFNTI